MRPLTLLFILIFSTAYHCQSQQDSSFIETINSIISKFQRGGIRYYADRLYPSMIKPVQMAVANGKIYSIYRNRVDTLVLTKEEKSFLSKELRALETFRWGDQVIRNSKSVDRDSLDQFIGQIWKHTYDSIRQVSGQKELDKYVIQNGLYWGFSFSKPIFIRNGNICLFFIMNYFNSAGSHEWAFYRKENAVWKKWLVVSGGEW